MLRLSTFQNLFPTSVIISPVSLGWKFSYSYPNNIHPTPAYVWSEETLLFTEQDVVTALFIYCTFNILLGEIKNSYSSSQHPIYPYVSESVPQNPFFPPFQLKDVILTHPQHFLKVNFVMKHNRTSLVISRVIFIDEKYFADRKRQLSYLYDIFHFEKFLIRDSNPWRTVWEKQLIHQ